MRGLVAYKLVAYKNISVTNQYLVSPDYQIVVNIFFNCKYVRTIDYSFKHVRAVRCLKIRFYCLNFSAISNLNSSDFTTPNQSSEILILKIKMLVVFQNKRNGEIIGL